MKIGSPMDKIGTIALFAQEEQDSVARIISQFYQQIQSNFAMRVEELQEDNQSECSVDEAREMIDIVKLLLKRTNTLHDCADDMSSNEPDSDVPDDICDDTNIESCEANIHNRDQKIAATYCDQSRLQRWMVGERVEFSYAWTGVRKWVPGRIEQVSLYDAFRSCYEVRLDTGELKHCVFAHELRSIQPSNIPNN